jgi:hypothetical protein
MKSIFIRLTFLLSLVAACQKNAAVNDSVTDMHYENEYLAGGTGVLCRLQQHLGLTGSGRAGALYLRQLIPLQPKPPSRTKDDGCW